VETDFSTMSKCQLRLCRSASEAQKSYRALSERHRHLQKAHDELQAAHSALQAHANLFAGFSTGLEATQPQHLPQALLAADLNTSEGTRLSPACVSAACDAAADVQKLRAVLQKPIDGPTTAAARSDAGELEAKVSSSRILFSSRYLDMTFLRTYQGRCPFEKWSRGDPAIVAITNCWYIYNAIQQLPQ
jgi:hypothetical protein